MPKQNYCLSIELFWSKKKPSRRCSPFRKLIKSDFANGLMVDFIVNGIDNGLGGRADKGVNAARVDLVGGGGVIDKGESRAVVVGDGLA